MFQRSRFIGLLGVVVTLVSAPALAGPINVRSVDTGNFGQLSSMFASIGSTIDPLNDQSVFGLFQPVAGVAGLTLFFENPGAALRDQNEFGIYSAADPNRQLTVFGGPTNPVSSGSVQFLGNGSAQIAGNPSTNVAGFGGSFGFYLRNEFGTIFSEDSLNPGGNAQAFTYAGRGDLVNLSGAGCPGLGCSSDIGRWYIAFEDLPFALSDNNFADLVVQFEAVPVPEPASMVLLGTGLLGLASAARRRLRRETA